MQRKRNKKKISPQEEQEDIPVKEPEKVEELERRKSKRKATTQDSKLISTADGAPIDTSTHDPIIFDPIEKDHPIATDSTLPMLSDPFFCEPIIQSNTKVIDDALAQTLKELDEDDIFVELEKALSRCSISTISSTKTPSTELETKTIDIPAVKLLLECYDIIEGKDLKFVGSLVPMKI